MKKFFKLLGTLSLYMIITLVISSLSCAIQLIKCKEVDTYSDILFSGSIYQYNYLAYIIGTVIFFPSMMLLYKKFDRSFDIIKEVNLASKIITWIVLVIFNMIMLLLNGGISFYFILGLSNELSPSILFFITLLMWPMFTLIYITTSVFIMKRAKKEKKED